MNGVRSPSELQQALGNRYIVERELGGGGMSRTYVALETALDRRVVIKVLPPELAATVSHDRFHREILVSASLSHPNIVGILTVDEVEGLPYFTMPFVEGESLRMRIQRQGALSVAHAVSILRDVARALAFAHERHIVHRDIKPDNVLLTSGAAVVADFGVAKALSSARVRRREANDANITSAGTALGTPAYMAPEQAAGDPDTDHRADLYAFGVMAYEMLTGASPFAGRPPAQLLAAHISEPPQHIAALRSDIPRALADLVMRCLEKDPARRPQAAAEVAHALEDPAMVSGAFASSPTLPVVSGSAVAGGARWALGLAVAVLLVALGVFGARSGLLSPRQGDSPVTADAAPVDARSIAVLPLVSLSPDSADAYLATGITDELTSALSRVPGFRVASRTASRAVQERGVSPEEIGRELGVAYLVEGTVQRQGARLRVTARLVSASDGFTAWSDVYDRETKDLFAVQDFVARSVAAALSEELRATAVVAAGSGRGGSAVGAATSDATPSGVHFAGNPGTSDPVAYDHFLRGRALLDQRDGASLTQALREFEQAVRRDTGFARAQAGIASVYAVLPQYGTADVQTVHERGLAAANAALRIDSTLAEGLAARGALNASAWRFQEAAGDLQRAITIEPNNPLAHHWLGELRLLKGDVDGAMAAIAQATLLDPVSPSIVSVRALATQASGGTDSALAIAQRAMEFDPARTAPRLVYATLLLDAGRAHAAVKELEVLRARDPGSPAVLGALGAAYAAAGERTRAEQLLARLEATPSAPRVPVAAAKIRLALGDKAGALQWLERGADLHDPGFASEPLALRFWDSLRDDPRFAALARRVGFDPVIVIKRPPSPPPGG